MLYILSAIGILFPADLGVHMLQTPLMWAHYQDFLVENPTYSFTEFLDVHTGKEAEHDPFHQEQEEEIPCHHHHAIQLGALVFPIPETRSIEAPVLVSNGTLCFGDLPQKSPSNRSVFVWNPPRFS